MIVIGVIYSLLAGAAMIIWGDWMVGIFVDAGEAEVISYAYKYIRCLAWFYYLLAILGILRSGVQGLGHSGSAMFAGLTEMIARTVMGLFIIPVYGSPLPASPIRQPGSPQRSTSRWTSLLS